MQPSPGLRPEPRQPGAAFKTIGRAAAAAVANNANRSVRSPDWRRHNTGKHISIEDAARPMPPIVFEAPGSHCFRSDVWTAAERVRKQRLGHAWPTLGPCTGSLRLGTLCDLGGHRTAPRNGFVNAQRSIKLCPIRNCRREAFTSMKNREHSISNLLGHTAPNAAVEVGCVRSFLCIRKKNLVLRVSSFSTPTLRSTNRRRFYDVSTFS